MRRKRLRFTVRTLIVCVAVVAGLLAIGMRFGPHAVWLLTRSRLPSVEAIPTSTLHVEPTTEVFVRCDIGPLAIELPRQLRENFDVLRDPSSGSVNVRFTDGSRSATVNLTPMKDFVMFPTTGFPDRATQTHGQLYRHIANVESSDFAFSMTVDELRWHQWLVNNRRLLPTIESIEHLDRRPNLEGNLLRFSSTKGIAYNFEWATTDGEWKGAVTFHDPGDDPTWIRKAASTFAVTDDPSDLLNITDAEVEAFLAPGDEGP